MVSFSVLSPNYPIMMEEEVQGYVGAAYEKGRSIGWIARKLGVSNYLVATLLRESGVKIRPPRVATKDGERVCWYCDQKRLLTEFHKDRTKAEGRSYVCKQCRKDTYETTKQSK